MPRTKAKQPQGGVVFLFVTILLMIVGLFNSLGGGGSEGGGELEPTETSVFNPSPIIPTPSPFLPPTNWWEVYFTDPVTVNNPDSMQGSVGQVLIDDINAAQYSIHIASFEFDLTPVAVALIAAHNRGVDVRWVTDDENGLLADEEPGRGQFGLLQAAGIEVRADTRSALMHNKFWIFDGQIVWTGSTNITKSAIFRQNNNVLVIHSARAISSEELYTTRPPLKINTVFYTVGSDGPLMIDAGPSTFHGPTSDDGHTFFVMDIDTSDRETRITSASRDPGNPVSSAVTGIRRPPSLLTTPHVSFLTPRGRYS